MRTPLVLSLALSLSFPLASQAQAAPKGEASRVTVHDLHAAQLARTARLRSMAPIFERIAIQKNWQGSHVVHHDANVTAFLDITDPQHPHFDAQRPDEDEGLHAVPVSRRAHILVVPNVKREHIATTFDAKITLEDLEATTQVVQAAHALAEQLQIKDARVYVNQTHQIGVGYLHVHIVGERTQPYPTVTAP